MSCPTHAGEMAELLAHRFDPEAPEPAGWPETAAHLAECADCRRRALALDPSLLFGGLGRPQAPVAASPEEMIQAVTAMRRGVPALARLDRVERGESSRHWRGWTAAAGIVLMALSFGAFDRRPPEAAPELVAEPVVVGAADVYGRDEMSGSALEDIPLVENPGPGFRVRETDAEGGSLAFVYQTDLDEGLLGG